MYAIRSYYVVNTDRVSASLQIVNKEGNTFLNQPVSGNSTFFKLVNLKSLPDGVYTVTLNSKGTLYNRKFTVQKAQATIEKIPVRRITSYNVCYTKLLRIPPLSKLS